MKTIMELVAAQIKPRRSPYKVKPCDLYNTVNISGRHFSLSYDKQIQFTHAGYAFIMIKENNAWHFMCEQTETSEDPYTVSPELEERAFRHMIFLANHFSDKLIRKYEVIQTLECTMMN